MAVSDHRAIWLTAHRPTYTHAGPEAMSGPAISHLVLSSPGFCVGIFRPLSFVLLCVCFLLVAV